MRLMAFFLFLAVTATAQDLVQLSTQGRTLPNRIENVCNPNWAENGPLLRVNGWRLVPSVAAVSNGYTRSVIVYIEGDGTTAAASYTDTSLAYLAAQAVTNAIIAASNAVLQAAAMLEIQSQLDNAERITKGLALTLIDEINLLRDRITSNDAVVAASTSLANFQSRQAALSNMPPRTVVGAKTAIYNKAKALP